MFSILNMNKASAHLAIKIESPNGDSIELTIGPMICKRNKEELAPEHQFTLINAYLDYKGREFKQLLYMAILDAEYAVEEASFCKGLSNPPTRQIYRVLDMFDMADVEHFVKNIYRITPPSILKPAFDQQIESDGLGTRVQTYIQQDYYELAALTIPIKAIIGLLGQYAIRKDSSLSAVHKEYALFNIIENHPIMQYPATQKIKAWAGILIKSNLATGDAVSVTVIEKQLPSSELSSYILAVVMIQKLSIAAIITDDRERNIITRIYNYIVNKLKVKGGSNTKIRDKKPLSDTDSANGDKESVVEAYRIISNITSGTEVELNWYTGNLDLLVCDYRGHVNKALLAEVHNRNQCFKVIPVSREQVTIAGMLFKDMLDPRSLDYINIDGIINILSLGFVVLWEMGHKEVAMLLTAKPVYEEADVVDINITPNVRLDPELKAKLAIHYPYEKQLNRDKTASVIEASITKLTYNTFRHKRLPNAPSHCIAELYGDGPVKVLQPAFKNHLARLIIDIEERRNARTSNEA